MSLARQLRERIKQLRADADRLGVTTDQAAAASERLRDDLPLRSSYLNRVADELERQLALAGEDVTAVERRRG